MPQRTLGDGLGSGYDTGFIDAVQTYQNVASPDPDDQSRDDSELANDVLDAIVAIETILGVNPHGSFASVKARLDAAVLSGSAGLSTYAVGDILYASTTAIVNRLAAVAVGSVVASAGVNTAPAYSTAPQLTSATFTGTGANAVKFASQTFCSFVIRVVNTAGTLQHQIWSDSASQATPANMAPVSGASGSLNNTPVVSSSVDFTAGVGVHSAAVFYLVLNTGAVAGTGHNTYLAVVEIDTTGTIPHTVQAAVGDVNVNGVTRIRPFLVLHDGAGATANWNTTTIPSGKEISVRVFGFISA